MGLMKSYIARTVVGIVGLSVFSQIGSATAILIDDFGKTQVNPVLTSNTNSHTAIGPIAGILGGFRALDNFCVSGCDDLTSSDFKVRGPNHDVVLNNQDFNTASALVTYSGSLNGPNLAVWNGDPSTSTPTAYGLAGVDLSGGGTNTQIRIIGHTDLDVKIIATFYTGGGSGYARASYTLVGAPTNTITALRFDNTGDALFTYTGAANDTMWTTVGVITAITFQIDGRLSASSDTNISYFGADSVPEPASFGMLAGGLGGLLWYARKKVQAKN
jgi:hypothetical protein